MRFFARKQSGIKYIMSLFLGALIIVLLLNVIDRLKVRNEELILQKKHELFRQMDMENNKRAMDKLCKSDDLYQKRMDMLMEDSKVFPIPLKYRACISYEDSFGGSRTYGGERLHEGCDIMSVTNVRGEIPVISMTKGVIENIGWLKLGGYRIGIRSSAGVYYYYAHLSSYAPGLKEGMKVNQGQILGFMGDTGYSEIEGTTGKFDVHLHVGIYLHDKGGEDFSINPYWILKTLDN